MCREAWAGGPSPARVVEVLPLALPGCPGQLAQTGDLEKPLRWTTIPLCRAQSGGWGSWGDISQSMGGACAGGVATEISSLGPAPDSLLLSNYRGDCSDKFWPPKSGCLAGWEDPGWPHWALLQPLSALPPLGVNSGPSSLLAVPPVPDSAGQTEEPGAPTLCAGLHGVPPPPPHLYAEVLAPSSS